MLNFSKLSRPLLHQPKLLTTRGVATGYKGPDTLFDFVRNRNNPDIIEVIPLVTFVSVGLFGGVIFGFYHLSKDPHLRHYRSGGKKTHTDELDEPLKRVLESVDEYDGE